MRITLPKKPNKQFCEIPIGDLFINHDTLYIKIKPETPSALGTALVVGGECGGVCTEIPFCDTASVTPVSEIIIKV